MRGIINHYWIMKGSKFLLTYELNQIIKNVFFTETSKTQKKTAPQKNTGEKENLQEITGETEIPQEKKKETPFEHEETAFTHFEENKMNKTSNNCVPISSIKFIINILDPQINLTNFSKSSQILLNSKKNCLFIFYENYLPFDKLKMDVRKQMKFFFYDLELFAASTNIDLNNQIFWLSNEHSKKNKQLSSGSKENIYEQSEGILNRIAQCNYFSIILSYFKLSESEIDFSTAQIEKTYNKEKMFSWNGEPRMTNFTIHIGKLMSFMDSKSYSHFRNGINLLMTMVSSDKKTKEIEKESKDLFAELKKFSSQTIINNIQEKNTANFNNYKQKKSCFEYCIESGEFSMTKENQAFLHFKIENFNGSHVYYQNESCTYELSIRRITVKNLLETNDLDYNMIICTNDNMKEINNFHDSPMINMIIHYNNVNGINSSNKWKYYEKYEIKIVPMIIRMTEEIYNYYYEYIFASNQSMSQDLNNTINNSEKSQINVKSTNKKKKSKVWQCIKYIII